MSAPALKGNELSQEEELWLGAVLAACKAHNVTPKSKYEAACYAIVCKGNAESAVKRIAKVQKFEADEGLETCSNDEALEFLHDTLPGAFIPAGRSLDGLVTFGMAASDFDLKKLSGDKAYALMFKATLLMYDGLTPNIEECRKGCVFAMEAKGFGWHNFSMELEKKSAILYQDGYPIKIKAMILIDPPMIISAIIQVCKVFLKKKIRDRMKNIKSKALPEHFDMSELPKELGGTFATPFRAWLQEGLAKREASIKEFGTI
mmetsp:Transcript_60128/g.137427  ORF Transcript_60128/g.137427 Transcript_60128/m.137427 type:complete len:261 (-) Transcript_60128:108-890(-)|eukprot:CAMPEP_0180187750 /NCGR_PEP_ID=MMETSP0986-20121125/43713_1 /TAXON_ID=697907 /ORGANISM="non described non described, Strain CCMP2293" /LENGTH=260 /DNA_ID=CAMNT_0022141901 /DNA_START=197 /DNA_END=979 /DNA_ORIENTATION=-